MYVCTSVANCASALELCSQQAQQLVVISLAVDLIFYWYRTVFYRSMQVPFPSLSLPDGTIVSKAALIKALALKDI